MVSISQIFRRVNLFIYRYRWAEAKEGFIIFRTSPYEHGCEVEINSKNKSTTMYNNLSITFNRMNINTEEI